MQLFERYWLQPQVEQVEFTIEITSLLDMLKIFIASDVGGIQMQYPGEHQELVLKSILHEHDTCTQEEQQLLPTVFSKIETLAFAASTNLSEYMNEPCSTIFSDKGYIFKDAVEDLSVGGSTVLVEMKDHPPQFTLYSVNPDIEVYIDVPMESLTGFSCTSPLVDFSYDTKNIVRAFSVSPNRKLDLGYDAEHHCGITIDPHGLMKVVHMWKSLRHKREQQHDEVASVNENESSESEPHSMVVTQFLIMPKADVENSDQRPRGSGHLQHDDGLSSGIFRM